MEIISDNDIKPYNSVPVGALNTGARKQLSKYLNIPMEIPTDEGYIPDYSGVAEILGFTYNDIQNFSLNVENATCALLDEWQTKRGATIGRLCDILKQLNRLDVLNGMEKFFERDAKAWTEKQKQWNQSNPNDTAPSSLPEEPYVDEYRYMVTEDADGDGPAQFDAFVCSASEDIGFVKEMIRQLEECSQYRIRLCIPERDLLPGGSDAYITGNLIEKRFVKEMIRQLEESSQYRIRLCIPERDLLPGGSDAYITGNLIEKRCRRMVVVISPHYLASPQCDFQTKFAHALSPGSRSKKVLPVLIKTCMKPSVLRHITHCDFTKPDVVEWMWPRLAKAILAPLKASEVQVDSRRLDALRLDLDTDSLASFSSTATSYLSHTSTSC